MGTRHLIQAVVDGELRLSQYGQFDGYLEGQGKDIGTFIFNANLDQMREQLRKLRFIDPDQAEAIMVSWIGKPVAEWGGDEHSQAEHAFPEFMRSTSAKILQLIHDGEVGAGQVVDSSDFARDRLFCEYVYTLDFDDMTISVTAGHPERHTRLFTFSEFFDVVNDEDERDEAESWLNGNEDEERAGVL
jgi:hypothetical protein